MESVSFLFFPPFRLDPVSERLWREEQPLTLRPKALAVLRYLVEHPGLVVSKEELLHAVWPDTVVTEAVLKVCIHEIRIALGEDPQTPRFIQTVPRRGYRFIAPVTTSPQPVWSPESRKVWSPESGYQEDRLTVEPPASSPQSLFHSPHSAIGVVGREAELQQLHGWLEKALCGERQVVFVTGEPGIGKTTLVEAFVARVTANPNLWVMRGQCVEHYGAGEAYLPVLQALERLWREPGRNRLLTLLDRYAPTWLAQLPALLDPAERERVQLALLGTTRERMLREMAEVLEVLTVETPLVLVLEDLHWSDSSTLALLATLARRREPARLLILGTYRPVEMQASGHPLKELTQELHTHRQCQDLPLEGLSEAAVAEYLRVRFAVGARHTVPLRELARVLHQRTEGNPLFLVNVVDEWVAQGLIEQTQGQWILKDAVGAAAATVPESVREMIQKQIDHLNPREQQVLEGASIVGMEFSAATVAAGIAAEVREVEEWCEGLVRRHLFLHTNGSQEWPDGTVAASYRFLHTLYQQVWYSRVPAGRRRELHQRIGEREEGGYRAQAAERAAELAVHFEQGRDYRRAVYYHQRAAEKALQRYAYQEAIAHLTKGLELLKALADTPERAQQELGLQLTLGVPLIATKGQGEPEVGKVYTRARELCQQLGDTPQLFTALRGLRFFHLGRGELQTARQLAEQLLAIAQNVQNPIFLLEAHRGLGATLYWLGEFAPAREHLERGIALLDPHQRSLVSHSGLDPSQMRAFCQIFAGLTLWHLGYPDQALQMCNQALTLAQELAHPHSLASTLAFAAWLHQFRQEGQLTQERAEAVIALSSEQGFALYLAMGSVFRGWALVTQGQREEGIAQLRQGLAALQDIGAELTRPYALALLAEAYGKAGQAEEGLRALAEALAALPTEGKRAYEAELYRLKGELLLRMGERERGRMGENEKVAHSPTRPLTHSSPEACFRKALDLARQQKAKSLELRAATSLSRLWQQQGKTAEARQLLAEIYNWFTEGFNTKDLQEAKTLLEALA